MTLAPDELGGDADPFHDLGAQAEEPHLEALEIGGRIDLLAEPAGGLGRDHAADQRLDVVPGVNLVHQSVAAAVEDPAEIFAGAGPERHRREQGQRLFLAEPITGCRPGCIQRPGGDGIEHLQRRNERVRLVKPDADVATAHRVQALGKIDAAGAQLNELAGKGAPHLPVHPVRGRLACVSASQEAGKGQSRRGELEVVQNVHQVISSLFAISIYWSVSWPIFQRARAAASSLARIGFVHLALCRRRVAAPPRAP
jgi:hypothetical protein